MLRLQAKPVTLFINVSLLTGYRSIQEITAVKLHPWFSRQDFQHSPGFWLMDSRRERQAVTFPIDDKIVIVSMPHDQLFIIVVDSSTYRGRIREIERRAFDRPKFAGRDQGLIDRSKPVCIERKFMAKNIAITFSRQIEVTVLRKIQRCGFVG